jgi:8-oxo-dGTP pyrophosphatase MutT (NUDIX family)
VTRVPVPPGVAELLARYPTDQPPVSAAGAAVTLVLRTGLVGVEVLLIERATSETDPASGQVALPGGHVSDDDGNLTATALRELEEEVGLSRADLDGELRFVSVQHARRFGLDVGVFVGGLAATAQPPTARSPQEVAHVFWLPRSALSETRRVERETSAGLLPVNATVHAGHVLWGFTRRVLRQFFELPLEDESFGPLFSPPPPARG